MKPSQLIIILVSTFLIVGKQGSAQGTFQNLDFENPIPPLIRDGNFQVPIANALPGWSGYLNGNSVDRVDYDSLNLSGPSITLSDSLFLPPIQGSYSVYLKSSSDTGGTSAAIGQNGQIPSSASSLRFLRTVNSGFTVSFEGQLIPLLQVGTSGSYLIMAGDISMFAGQTGELRFTGGGLFDAIQFSNQPVPEPGTIGLFGIGALLTGWHLRRRATS